MKHAVRRANSNGHGTNAPRNMWPCRKKKNDDKISIKRSFSAASIDSAATVILTGVVLGSVYRIFLQLGNHDHPRMATRINPMLMDGLHMMQFLLPGTPITYYADELGMQNTYVRWDQSLDPAGRNVGLLRYTKFSRDPVRSPFPWDASPNAGECFCVGRKDCRSSRGNRINNSTPTCWFRLKGPKYPRCDVSVLPSHHESYHVNVPISGIGSGADRFDGIVGI